MGRGLACSLLRPFVADEAEDAAMLAPGLLARRLGPDFEPARPRQPRHHPFDRLGKKRVAAETGDLDMEIGADLVPLLARHVGAAGIEHGFDGIEVRLACAVAGKPYRRDLERLAKFRELFDLAEVDRGDRPVA